MNKEIRELNNDLVTTLNGSNIPIEVKRLVVLNIYNQLEKEADNAILNESRAITEEGEVDNAESPR